MKNSGDDPLLILASRSPRRKYLLEQAGLSFSVIPSSIDETSVPISSPETYVRVLSEAKADNVSEKYPGKWVIGADTIVLKDETILGKPGSRDEAPHHVKTAQRADTPGFYRLFNLLQSKKSKVFRNN